MRSAVRAIHWLLETGGHQTPALLPAASCQSPDEAGDGRGGHIAGGVAECRVAYSPARPTTAPTISTERGRDLIESLTRGHRDEGSLPEGDALGATVDLQQSSRTAVSDEVADQRRAGDARTNDEPGLI